MEGKFHIKIRWWAAMEETGGDQLHTYSNTLAEYCIYQYIKYPASTTLGNGYMQQIHVTWAFGQQNPRYMCIWRYAGCTMQNLAEKGSLPWNKAHIHNRESDNQHYLWVELAHNGI